MILQSTKLIKLSVLVWRIRWSCHFSKGEKTKLKTTTTKKQSACSKIVKLTSVCYNEATTIG